MNAGAILLQKVNVNHLNQVLDQIKAALSIGLRGSDLSEYIENLFIYNEGETPPPEEWDTEEGAEGIAEGTRDAFKKLGLKGEELEEQMRKWRG